MVHAFLAATAITLRYTQALIHTLTIVFLRRIVNNCRRQSFAVSHSTSNRLVSIVRLATLAQRYLLIAHIECDQFLGHQSVMVCYGLDRVLVFILKYRALLLLYVDDLITHVENIPTFGAVYRFGRVVPSRSQRLLINLMPRSDYPILFLLPGSLPPLGYVRCVLKEYDLSLNALNGRLVRTLISNLRIGESGLLAEVLVRGRYK